MPAPQSPIAVIFDVDGVLLDSFEAHFDSWKHVAAEHGIELTREQFAAGFGRTSREVITETWADRVRSPQEVRAVEARKEALFRDIVVQERPIMPGAIGLIDRLDREGIRLAIGSSGPPENVRIVLELLGAADRFQAVVTGADVQRGKPDPQVFLTAAERLGIPPAQCIVIEDAPVGIRAAHNAGMAAVALISTGRRPSDFKRETPEVLIHSLDDLQPAGLRQLVANRAASSR